MRPSLPFLFREFGRWNSLCFGGVLPLPALKITSARNYAGIFRVRYTSRGKRQTAIPSISLSALYDHEEAELTDVLIHEMIHYYIWHQKLNDDGPHGGLFRSIMERINRQHCRNLSIRTRVSAECAATALRNRAYILMVCFMAESDRRLILTPSRSCLRDIYHTLRKSPSIRHIDCYVSTDPRLSRYPQVRTPKLFAMEDGVLDEIVSKASETTCKGFFLQ